MFDLVYGCVIWWWRSCGRSFGGVGCDLSLQVNTAGGKGANSDTSGIYFCLVKSVTRELKVCSRLNTFADFSGTRWDEVQPPAQDRQRELRATGVEPITAHIS